MSELGTLASHPIMGKAHRLPTISVKRGSAVAVATEGRRQPLVELLRLLADVAGAAALADI